MLGIFFLFGLRIDIFDTSVEMKLFFARVDKVTNRGAAEVCNATSAKKSEFRHELRTIFYAKRFQTNSWRQ